MRKANIPDRISDAVGTIHADNTLVRAEPGSYCSVVTLGAYRAVKVTRTTARSKLATY